MSLCHLLLRIAAVTFILSHQGVGFATLCGGLEKALLLQQNCLTPTLQKSTDWDKMPIIYCIINLGLPHIVADSMYLWVQSSWHKIGAWFPPEAKEWRLSDLKLRGRRLCITRESSKMSKSGFNWVCLSGTIIGMSNVCNTLVRIRSIQLAVSIIKCLRCLRGRNSFSNSVLAS